VTITHLLYLHGFRSSPQSMKARQVAAWVGANRPDLVWWCPQLPPSPREAMDMLFARLMAWPARQMAVIGSSLGGFYGCVVAERFGCLAVLLNPAVDPAQDLARHIGETTAWHSNERFFFRAEFIAELRAMTPLALTGPQRYFAVIAKGDEVLDWRAMTARCAGCKIKLLEGGDHALSDFSVHLPDVIEFLALKARVTR
jgi:uncharacterized protein